MDANLLMANKHEDDDSLNIRKSKEQILKNNGLQIGFKATYCWEDILKAMDEFRLQFDDQYRSMYYEDKIDMLNRVMKKMDEEIGLLKLELQSKKENCTCGGKFIWEDDETGVCNECGELYGE